MSISMVFTIVSAYLMQILAIFRSPALSRQISRPENNHTKYWIHPDLLLL